MAVTRSDVAQAAGVSPAVVSYVLNNGPRPVSKDARARVTAAVEKLGYRPNAIASALRGGSTHSIGFMSPNPRNPFYAELGEALERHLSARGYLVLTGNTYYDRSREDRYLRTFIDRKVDGLIFSSGISLVASPAPGIEQPVLALDFAGANDQFSTVRTDDAADSASAVEHLQRHGHELIGCIGGPSLIGTEPERINGWRRQQDAAQLPSGDELVAFGEMSEDGGNAAASQLLSDHGRPWALHGHRPTALFVASDVQAIGVIYACYELGLRVPEDVAIVSLGGTKAVGYTIPPMTSMRQDIEFTASLATENLLARIHDSSLAPSAVTLRGNLVIGRSCGC